MTTILSWDVGIKNLAYCKIKFTNDDYEIVEWNIIKLCEDNEKVNKLQINQLAKKLFNELDKNPNLLNDVNNILIENQPSYKNPKMKTISILLYSYFIIKSKADVNLIAPCRKLSLNKNNTMEELKKGKTKNQIYSLTKKLSKQYCNALITDNDKQILNKSKKKDDLCDAFLQAFRFNFKNIPIKYVNLLNGVS